MNNPLENFKNPFDIDGSFAQKILNTDRIFGNTNKILGIPEEDQVEQEEAKNEEYFISSGTDTTIERYYQALYYGKGTYGMDCNACCVMYFLQSYGLILPQMSRKQFEYVFTPLFPDLTKHISVNEYNQIQQDEKVKNKPIKIEGGTIFSPETYNLPIKTDMFQNIFGANDKGENFLRGRLGAIFPHTDDGIIKLKQIYDKFGSLLTQPDYKFLGEYASKYYNLNYMGLKNKYVDLVNGITDKEYFQRNVIFIGLHAYKPPYPSHYCLIVNNPKKEIFKGIEFWVYPADDPYKGQTNVYVPLNDSINFESIMESLVQKTKIDLKQGKKPSYLIFKNCAIGVI